MCPVASFRQSRLYLPGQHKAIYCRKTPETLRKGHEPLPSGYWVSQGRAASGPSAPAAVPKPGCSPGLASWRPRAVLCRLPNRQDAEIRRQGALIVGSISCQGRTQLQGKVQSPGQADTKLVLGKGSWDVRGGRRREERA